LSLSLSPSRSSNLRGRRGFTSNRGGSLPHARYGVDLAQMPDTYIEPFTAYRSWNWKKEGVTSLNGVLWTPKQAFEATCHYHDDWKSMLASANSEQARKFWKSKEHHVPDDSCTCGMYAGINMQHMIDINYVNRGIHGEVHLWGRLYRHTLGWRAQYAYPKYFVVPANKVPFKFEEAQKRLAMLVEFDVDIYLQPDKEARAGQERIPLWMKDFGYSQQGLSVLIEKRKKWYQEHPKTHTLAVGDRVAVLGGMDGGGIGVVKEIDGEELYYTLFAPNVVYRKKLKDIVWNEQNWRWEMTGLGFMRKREQETRC
jgi:hypothetical protein